MHLDHDAYWNYNGHTEKHRLQVLQRFSFFRHWYIYFYFSGLQVLFKVTQLSRI